MKKEILDVESPGYSKLTLEVKENHHQYNLIINKLKRFLHSVFFLSIWTTTTFPICHLINFPCIPLVCSLVLETALIMNPFPGQVFSLILVDQGRPRALQTMPEAVAFSSTKLILLVCFTKVESTGMSCSRGGLRRIQHFSGLQLPSEIEECLQYSVGLSSTRGILKPDML